MNIKIPNIAAIISGLLARRKKPGVVDPAHQGEYGEPEVSEEVFRDVPLSHESMEPILGESVVTVGKKGKEVDTAFDDSFVIGTQTVAKKDILNFIRGKCAPVVGTDYYYAYTYEKGQLNFIATKSSKHITGGTTVFAPAFFEEGNYIYKYGARYFMVTNTDGVLEWHLCPEPPTEAYTEVNDDRISLPASAPKTMLFQWSLHKQHVVTELALSAVFMLAVVYYGFTLSAYNVVQKKADDIKRQQTAISNAPKPLTATIDLAEMITELRNKIAQYDGTIRQIKIGKEGIVSAVVFPTENYTRMFLNRHGGKYEDAKVLLGFNLPGGSNANAVGQGGEKQKGSDDAGKPANAQAGQPGPVQTGPGK